MIVNAIPISQLSRKVQADQLTYLSNGKLYRIERAMRSANKKRIPGSFVEFGIALGGSGVLIAKTAVEAGRSFHGFDVFGMIPPPTSDKDDEKSKQRYKVIVSGKSNGIAGDLYYGYVDNLYEKVRDTFQRYGLGFDDGKVMLHKGLFEETLPEVDIGPVAIAHIDCDWYDPVIYCLEALDPIMSPQGQIILDDYNDYGGCKNAVDEFVAKNPSYDFITGHNAILIKR